jgi:predicted phage terminase large subunit-like protein
MNQYDRQAYNAALRSDFRTFLHRCVLTLNPGAIFLDNWHLEGIAYQLDRVRKGEETRLIINMPPRYLKSITVTVAFTAYVLGLNPKLRIFSISYGEDLSKKHAADFRAIVQSAWYRDAFPKMRIARATDAEIHTTERGFRKSTSINAALTGLGGNLFIVDDPQKAVDAQSDTLRENLHHWFTNTLLSRLDSKERDAVIVVMQRVHLHDLTGYLLESGGWTHLSLAAIAEEDEQIAIGNDDFYYRLAGEALHPEHESLATLNKLRLELGSDVFAAQYQQSPVPPGGGMIKKKWLRYYPALPERKLGHRIYMSWDTAAKNGAQNDWSVCTVWLLADKVYYLLDMVRGRYEYPELRDTAIALAERYKPFSILIEDASTGTALAQELKQAGLFPVRLIPVHHDKRGRLYVSQGKFERGQVQFPMGQPFMSEVEKELLSFPQGKTDDIVDSISQALAFDDWGYDDTLSWV